LKKLNTAKEISAILKNSQNRMYLNSDSLLMDILSSNNDMKYEKRWVINSIEAINMSINYSLSYDGFRNIWIINEI